MQFQCKINSELESLQFQSSSSEVIRHIRKYELYFSEMPISLSSLDQIPTISHYNGKPFLASEALSKMAC